MSTVQFLPHLNAALNAVATLFLFAGFFFIRSGNMRAHRACMITVVFVSGIFLVSYVIHRMHAPIFEFQGQGVIRIIYYMILISHVVLAIAIVPMVSLTLFNALKGRFDKHKKIARWTWPTWMYVSITGVIVYVMLYQLYPSPEFAGLH